MTSRDRLLALLVAGCWGLNFPATALALQHFPPLLMVALRFALVAVPTLLLVPRPQVRLRWLIGIGLGIGVLQFGFLYLGMASGMPSGLASLVLQASAPFTVLLAGIFLAERITRRQVVGIGLAVAGLAAIALHRGQTAALLPVLLTLAGALGWAIGNVCSRQAAAPNPFHLTLWMSVVPPLPMLAVSLLVEGPQRIGAALATAFTPAALPSVLGPALHRGDRHPARVRDLEHPARPLPVELGRTVLHAGADRRRTQLLGAARRGHRPGRGCGRRSGDRRRTDRLATPTPPPPAEIPFAPPRPPRPSPRPQNPGNCAQLAENWAPQHRNSGTVNSFRVGWGRRWGRRRSRGGGVGVEVAQRKR